MQTDLEILCAENLEDDSPGSTATPEEINGTGLGRKKGERRYTVGWAMGCGPLKGEFRVEVLVPGENFADVRAGGRGEEEEELGKKVERLEEELRRKEEVIRGMREGVLRAIVAER